MKGKPQRKLEYGIPLLVNYSKQEDINYRPPQEETTLYSQTGSTTLLLQEEEGRFSS